MSLSDYDGVLDRFAFHPATKVTGPIHDAVRNNHRALASFITQIVPRGRHQSLALTALQESMMWCNAAVACDHPDRDGEQLNPNSGTQDQALASHAHTCQCGEITLHGADSFWTDGDGRVHRAARMGDVLCDPAPDAHLDDVGD